MIPTQVSGRTIYGWLDRGGKGEEAWERLWSLSGNRMSASHIQESIGHMLEMLNFLEAEKSFLSLLGYALSRRVKLLKDSYVDRAANMASHVQSPGAINDIPLTGFA